MKRSVLAIAGAGLFALLALPVAKTIGQPDQETQRAAASNPAYQSRIAVLDVVRVFNECAQIKDLNERMRQKTEDYASERKRREEELNNRVQELKAFRPGTPDYESRRKQLINLSIEARVWAEQTEADLERQKYDWTIVIYEQTMEKAGEVARADGFDIVLQRTDFKPQDTEQKVEVVRAIIQQRSVIFHVPQIDITERVIKALDAAYREAAKKQPPPAAPPMGPGSGIQTQPSGAKQ